MLNNIRMAEFTLAGMPIQHWLVPFSVLYFILLMLLVRAVARGKIFHRLMHHSGLHTLAVGVALAAWGIYILPGAAYLEGFNYLAYLIGISALFLCAPALLEPILRLVKNYQLISLPDLLAFRYKNRLVGQLSTSFLLVITLLYFAIQILVLDQVVQALGGQLQHSLLIYFTLILFLLYVQRLVTSTEYRNNKPLMLVIAIQSLLKMGFLVILALVCLFWVFDGWADLSNWLDQHPVEVQRLFQPMTSGSWQLAVFLMSFFAILMPHMYQSIFVENNRPDEMKKISWGVSLYLLPLAVVVPIVMWAAIKLGLVTQPEHMLKNLVLSLDQTWLILLFYLAILSALCSSLMIGLLALSSMAFNHFISEFYQPNQKRNTLESYVRERKFWLLGLLAALACSLFVLLRDYTLVSLAISALSGFLVLLPALIGVLFWPRANDVGCLLSLMLGIGSWALLQVGIYRPDQLDLPTLQLLYGFSPLLPHLELSIVTLGISSLGLVIGSLLSRQTPAEQVRALECAVYDPEPILRVQRWDIRAASVDDVEAALIRPLGITIAAQQVQYALQDLNLSWDEQRPGQLTRLRERLNFNLSALLGPAVSQDLLDRALPYHARLDLPPIAVRHALEQRLDDEQPNQLLSGTAAELDALRRFHRQMLHELPIGVCSINAQFTIMSWNRMMAELTDFGDEVVGWRLGDIPNVWGGVLMQFMLDTQQQTYRLAVQHDDRHYLVNLQRATVGEPDDQNQVLVIEDVTKIAELEKQLTHQDRLAAIGRLVAGVAHEIGNPVTGIAGLAQNLEADFDDPEIQDASQKILEQTHRIRSIVNALVGYARTDRIDQTQQQQLCLRSLVEESINLTRMGQRTPIRFINAIEPDLQIAGYGPQLHQVFINLFGNAIDASLQQPTADDIRIHVSAHQNNQQIHIEIEDDGSGLPNNELRGKLFEPFVTTKQYGQGTGLGLSLVQGIISSHGGRIQLIDKTDYDQGRGVIVQISLPAIYTAEEFR